MSQEPEPTLVRRFSAHAANDSRKKTHDVFGVSFEDAAFDFIDRWHPAPDQDGEIQIMLTERQTGERQCFRIDLVGGEAGFCD
jgi:hypothetical protein